MSKRMVANQNSGQALVELILAIALASLFLTSFVLGIIAVREAFNRSNISAEARVLLQSELESLRSIKETAWNSFSTPGVYHTEQAGNIWIAVPGTATNNNLTRSFTVEHVCRLQATSLPIDCTNPAAVSDPATKKITISVSWNFFGAHSLNSTVYLTRNFNNLAVTQTTLADFNPGNRVNTSLTNVSGGEVQLSSYSGASWANPQVIATRKLGGTVAANSIFVVNNKAYIVTNSQGGADFFIYDVTNPANPTALGSYDLGGTGYKVVVSGNYAYTATSVNTREMIILNISNPNSPTFVGAFNSAGGADGRSIFVSGTTAYLVTDNNTNGTGYEFYVVNVANPASPSQLGGLNLNSASRDLIVSGNFVYIASTNNNQELQIVNITNPNTPNLAGTFNIVGTNDGNNIFVINNIAYLGTTQLNILDVTNPASVSQIGVFNVAGSPTGIFVSGNYAFLSHTQAGSEFKVIDITNPTLPSLYGSTTLGAQGNVVFVLGNYAFLATANSNAQFQVIQGGSGGVYESSGTFESATISAPQLTTFNYFSLNSSIPANSTLRFQIATNNDNATWNYVGPDGTNATYFVTGQAINLAQVSARYFRYKGYFTGDGVVTPVLFDTVVNYSP